MPISLNNHETRIVALENSTSSGSGVSTNIGAGRVILKIASDLSAFTALITVSTGSEVPLISIVTGSNSNGRMVVKDIYNDKTFSIRLGNESDRNMYLTKDNDKTYRVSVTPLGGYSGNITLSTVSSLPPFYIKFIPWVYDIRTTTTGVNTTHIGTSYDSKAQTTTNTIVLEYAGKVLSDPDNIHAKDQHYNGHSAASVTINGISISRFCKKFRVTRKVNGGSAITSTYNSNESIPGGSALCFGSAPRGAVVELDIEIIEA